MSLRVKYGGANQIKGAMPYEVTVDKEYVQQAMDYLVDNFM